MTLLHPTDAHLSSAAVYALPTVLYLLLAQDDPPASAPRPFVLWSPPLKVLKINMHLLLLARDALRVGLPEMYLKNQSRRLFDVHGRESDKVCKINIDYNAATAAGSGRGGRGGGRSSSRRKKLLDVYVASREGGDRDDDWTGGAGAPVIVYVGGANWSWWTKKSATLMGLRFRRFGYTVVVPHTRQWPEVKTKGMVEDLRQVLEWTAMHVREYGGDPDRIYLLVSTRHARARGARDLEKRRKADTAQLRWIGIWIGRAYLPGMLRLCFLITALRTMLTKRALV